MRRAFLPALGIVAGFAAMYVAAPFFGAILWAVIAAVVFRPIHNRLQAMIPNWPNCAAFIVLLAIVLLVIVPAALLGSALLQQAASIYERLRPGSIDIAALFDNVQARLPEGLRNLLTAAGLRGGGSFSEALGRSLAGGLQAAARSLLEIGHGLLGFLVSLGVMLYLTFFFLRDGDDLMGTVERHLPLSAAHRTRIITKLATIIRASVRGSLIVAVVQGALGGLVISVLGLPGALFWGVAMGCFSLLPSVGTGLVWVPMSLYLVLTESYLQAAALAACGFFLIGTVDNLIRPMLVGHEARLPDYVVLIATLGGFELFGFNGFVIGPVVASLFMTVWSILVEQSETAQDG